MRQASRSSILPRASACTVCRHGRLALGAVPNRQTSLRVTKINHEGHRLELQRMQSRSVFLLYNVTSKLHSGHATYTPCNMGSAHNAWGGALSVAGCYLLPALSGARHTSNPPEKKPSIPCFLF